MSLASFHNQVELTRAQAFREAVKRGEINILDLRRELPWFADAADWTPWDAFLCAAYGLPMTDEEHEIFVECTGRTKPPTKRAREVYGIVGRRGRKTAIEALMGVFAAAEIEYVPPIIPPDARCVIPILGKNMEDAKACREYALAILRCPGMRWLLADDGDVKGSIRLTEPVDLVIKAASLMAGRTKAIPIALCDEVAFWAQEEAKVDGKDVIRGIRPAMATVPGGGMLVCMSSPWTKNGIMGEAYDKYYGKDGDVLVWKAPTIRMHDSETIRAFVVGEYEKDPISADAEFGANFRKVGSDTYITQEMLDKVVESGTKARHRSRWHYWAFIDASGGANDSFAMAIAHFVPETLERKKHVVLDAVYAWPAPFNTRTVCREVATHLGAWGLDRAEGDHYSGNWIVDNLKEEHVIYSHVDRNKSEIYIEFVPRVTGEEVILLDDPVMKSQFLRLKRRAVARGVDAVDHPPNEHDDVANAAAGVVVRAWEYGKNRGIPEEERPEPTNTIEQFAAKKRDLYLRETQKRNDNASTPRGRRQLYRRQR